MALCKSLVVGLPVGIPVGTGSGDNMMSALGAGVCVEGRLVVSLAGAYTRPLLTSTSAQAQLNLSSTSAQPQLDLSSTSAQPQPQPQPQLNATFPQRVIALT